MSTTTPDRPHVAIIGAGFAGLEAAKRLERTKARVTIIDRRNHHVFQPLLYEVATAALNPSDVSVAIRTLFHEDSNVRVKLAEVIDIDVETRTLWLNTGTMKYDYLIVAAGAEPNYFGHPEWEEAAPSLKNLSEALEIRRRILSAYEAAELEPNPRKRRRLLTFAIVGGGPTGVELAGTMAEIARHTIACDFHNFTPKDTRVMLIEGGSRILPAMPPELSTYATEALEKRGVEVITGRMVNHIDDEGIHAGDLEIESATVLWAAGVKPSPLAEALGAPLRKGYVVVRDDLSIPKHPEVFVVGDMMLFETDGQPIPWMAQNALQSGRKAAENIEADLRQRARTPYAYKHKGSVAVVGRNSAVADLPRVKLKGALAWLLAWVVHIFWIVGFRDRVSVFLGWAYSYLTWRRDARLILPETPIELSSANLEQEHATPSETNMRRMAPPVSPSRAAPRSSYAQ